LDFHGLGRDQLHEAIDASRIWSAGHSASGVTEILDVAELVARTEAEYRA
jgi:hypothetical protein